MSETEIPVDTSAACRRVLDLADRVERGEVGGVGQVGMARLIRVAVTDSAAALIESDGSGE